MKSRVPRPVWALRLQREGTCSVRATLVRLTPRGEPVVTYDDDPTGTEHETCWDYVGERDGLDAWVAHVVKNAGELTPDDIEKLRALLPPVE